ncbi:hypothetical protein [Telluribacter humicola]|nr:hypothetical protein [Telluribacter humicola]
MPADILEVKLYGKKKDFALALLNQNGQGKSIKQSMDLDGVASMARKG